MHRDSTVFVLGNSVHGRIEAASAAIRRNHLPPKLPLEPVHLFQSEIHAPVVSRLDKAAQVAIRRWQNPSSKHAHHDSALSIKVSTAVWWKPSQVCRCGLPGLHVRM